MSFNVVNLRWGINKKDQEEGNGICFSQDGVLNIGFLHKNKGMNVFFFQDRIVGGLFNEETSDISGLGFIIYPDGTIFQGKIKNFKGDGLGYVFYPKNKNLHQVLFRDDKRVETLGAFM